MPKFWTCPLLTSPQAAEGLQSPCCPGLDLSSMSMVHFGMFCGLSQGREGGSCPSQPEFCKRADRLQETRGSSEVLLCCCNSLRRVVERKCLDDKGRVSQGPEGTLLML